MTSLRGKSLESRAAEVLLISRPQSSQAVAPIGNSVVAVSPSISGLRIRYENRRTEDLISHLALCRVGGPNSIEKLSGITFLGPSALETPLFVSSTGLIIDGVARWQYAKARRHSLLYCAVADLSEEESLIYLLQNQQLSLGLRAFLRIVLALELEEYWICQAKHNQRLGGEHKGSSNLTEAARVNVRKQIALIAGTSNGNVAKVKLLNRKSNILVLAALKSGELTIHKAWSWLKHSRDGGLSELEASRSAWDLDCIVSRLINKHRKPQLYGAKILGLVIRHTFRRHLTFNPHVHLLASNGGLTPTGDGLLSHLIANASWCGGSLQ